MNAFEQMMPNLPRLRHLELIAQCSHDVVDGGRWEIMAKDLQTFKFSFRGIYRVQSHQVDTFRTPFWMQVKKWFVAYAKERFFSVSQPITTEIDSIFPLPQYTTVPDTTFFYQLSDQLELRRTATYLNEHFPHVQTLIINDDPSVYIVRKVVDLKQIRNLILNSLVRNYLIGSLINEMPNLCQISIQQHHLAFLTEVRNQTLETIRTLKVDELVIRVNDKEIGNIFTIFPHLEHFHVDRACSIEEICQCLHGFKHLSTASFYYIADDSDEEEEQQRRPNVRSTLDKMRREERLDFTYRCGRSRICLWIGSQANDQPICSKLLSA